MLASEPVHPEELVMCDVIPPWFVIPAEAGIQLFCGGQSWIPAFAGMTEFLDIGVRTCGSSGARHVVRSLHLGSLSRLSPE